MAIELLKMALTPNVFVSVWKRLSGRFAPLSPTPPKIAPSGSGVVEGGGFLTRGLDHPAGHFVS